MVVVVVQWRLFVHGDPSELGVGLSEWSNVSDLRLPHYQQPTPKSPNSSPKRDGYGGWGNGKSS